jgi:predicted transcriptional regulator YdeE
LADNFNLQQTPFFGLYTNMTDESEFDYTIGCLRSSATQATDDLVQHTIPSSRYAHFSLDSMDRVKEMWHHIYGYWFLENDAERTRCFNFEIYHKDSKVQNNVNDDIYVLYTNFEHEGVNNTGMYSTIVGCTVEADAVAQTGLLHAEVPAGEYRHLIVPDNNPENVGPVWLDIGGVPESEKMDWRFFCEYECHHADGVIDVYVGLK